MAKPKDVITRIRKATRRKFSADEKIRIVLEGLRGETSISEICRREGIASSVYYKWSKAFLEAGKNGLTKDTLRDASTAKCRRRHKFPPHTSNMTGSSGLNFMNWANPGPGASTELRRRRVFERNREGTPDAAEGPSGTGFLPPD